MLVRTTQYIRVALMIAICAIGANVFAQTAFSTTQFTMNWSEDRAEQTTQLATLNEQIRNALNDSSEDFCFSLNVSPRETLSFTSLNCTHSNALSPNGFTASSNSFALMLGEMPFDFERSSTYSLTLSAHVTSNTPSDRQANSLIVSGNITNVDEAPVLQDYSMYYDENGQEKEVIRYIGLQERFDFNIFQHYRDPERMAVMIARLSVCDTGIAGDFGDGSCASAPVAGSERSDDNILSVRQVGSARLEFSVNESNITVAGVYWAKIYFGAMDQAGNVADDLVHTTIFVRRGVNNPPRFAGNATGFKTTALETKRDLLTPVAINPTPLGSWNATDLDSSSTNHMDRISYSLVGASAVCRDSVTNAVRIGDMCIAIADRGGVALDGHFLDFESPALDESKTFEVMLRATDGWDQVEVPIEVTLQNTNELYANTKDDGLVLPTSVRLLQGDTRSLNLADYFNDPEGDMITFDAYANILSDLVTRSNGQLTIHGIGTSADNPVYEDSISLTATDGMETVRRELQVHVRNQNTPPRFNERNAIAVGAEIAENQPVGTAVSRLVKYIDDDSTADEIQLRSNSSFFEGVVDPLWDDGQLRLCTEISATCTRQMGAIAVVTTTNLNFEQRAEHTVELSLYDGYEHNSDSNLEIQITVTDANDPPTVVGSISDQRVAVQSSLTLPVAEHFADEDADDRVIVKGVSKNTSVATIRESSSNELIITGVSLGTTEIEVIGTDNANETASLIFKLTVGPNLPPVANEEAIEDALPLNLEVVLGTNYEFSIDGLFTDPERQALTYSAESSDQDVLIANLVDDKVILTPRRLGNAELTLTATDDTGEATEVDRAIRVVEERTTTNQKPVVNQEELANQLPPAKTLVAGTTHTMNLEAIFSDPEDEVLRFEIESSDEDVLQATISEDGIEALLEGKTAGTAMLTLTATDYSGNSTTVEETITVKSDVMDENRDPVFDKAALAAALPADNSIIRKRFFRLVLDGVVSDPDGDDVNISVRSSNKAVLRVIQPKDSLTAFLIARSVGESELSIHAEDNSKKSVVEKVTIRVEPAEGDEANRPPQLDRDALNAALPPNNTISVSEFFEIDLSSLFSDPDEGDSVASISATSDDENVLFVSVDAEHLLTVLGTGEGMTSIRLTAADTVGAETIEPVEISVIAASANSVAFDSQSLNRNAPLALDVREALGDSITTETQLTIRPLVENTSLVSATSDGSRVILTALNEGRTSIKLHVESDQGVISRSMFFVEVLNSPPMLSMGIPTQTGDRVDDLILDLSDTFTDADGESIELFATVENSDIALISLSDQSLTIKGVSVGETTVLLTAMDESGNRVETSFVVSIRNHAPTVAGSFGPISLEVGGGAASFQIVDLFADDGDAMTYSVDVQASNIVEAALDHTIVNLSPLSRGQTTVTITATDTFGATATVLGQISVSDEQLKNVAEKALAGFGRSVLSSVSNSLESRARSQSHNSDLNQEELGAPNRAADATHWESSVRLNHEYSANSRLLTTDDQRGSPVATYQARNLSYLLGNGFTIGLGGEKSASTWTLWSRADRQSYGGVDYEGDVSNAFIGIDARPGERWLVGVSLGSHQGQSDYAYGTAEQVMEVELNQLLPYVRFNPSERTSIWGSLGVGQGNLDTTVIGAMNANSDLRSQTALLAGQHKITHSNRYEVSLRGDASALDLATELGELASDRLSASVRRVRVGVEGAYTFNLGNSMSITPFTQLNVRSDTGDGDGGSGVELSGGLRLAQSAFSIELIGHSFSVDGINPYTQTGGSITATYEPKQNGTGFSASIAPRWGSRFTGGQIWLDQMGPQSLIARSSHSKNRSELNGLSFDAQVGYGMTVAQEQFLLRPFVSVSKSEFDSRQVQIGTQMSQTIQKRASLTLGFSVGRIESPNAEGTESARLSARLAF